ncbi:dynein heavy chain, putative, partial [Hepatocystis sp. ex Piliocolobus tephrosceles]
MGDKNEFDESTECINEKAVEIIERALEYFHIGGQLKEEAVNRIRKDEDSVKMVNRFYLLNDECLFIFIENGCVKVYDNILNIYKKKKNENFLIVYKNYEQNVFFLEMNTDAENIIRKFLDNFFSNLMNNNNNINCSCLLKEMKKKFNNFLLSLQIVYNELEEKITVPNLPSEVTEDNINVIEEYLINFIRCYHIFLRSFMNYKRKKYKNCNDFMASIKNKYDDIIFLSNEIHKEKFVQITDIILEKKKNSSYKNILENIKIEIYNYKSEIVDLYTYLKPLVHFLQKLESSKKDNIKEKVEYIIPIIHSLSISIDKSQYLNKNCKFVFNFISKVLINTCNLNINTPEIINCIYNSIDTLKIKLDYTLNFLLSFLYLFKEYVKQNKKLELLHQTNIALRRKKQGLDLNDQNKIGCNTAVGNTAVGNVTVDNVTVGNVTVGNVADTTNADITTANTTNADTTIGDTDNIDNIDNTDNTNNTDNTVPPKQNIEELEEYTYMFPSISVYIHKLKILIEYIKIYKTYMKLEKIEIPGDKGKKLTEEVHNILNSFNLFNEQFLDINHEILKEDETIFINKYQEFDKKIKELNKRLVCVFIYSFDNDLKKNIKLLNSFLILRDIRTIEVELVRHASILCDSLKKEFILIDDLFIKYTTIVNMNKCMFLENVFEGVNVSNTAVSSVTGSGAIVPNKADFGKHLESMYINKNGLVFCQVINLFNSLLKRVEQHYHPINKILEILKIKTEQTENIKLLYVTISEKIKRYISNISDEWFKQTINVVNHFLNENIFKVERGMFYVNFHPYIFLFISNVKNFFLNNLNVNLDCLEIYKKANSFKKYINILNNITKKHNHVIGKTLKVERDLFKEKLYNVKRTLMKGVNEIKWTEDNIYEYIEQVDNDMTDVYHNISTLHNHFLFILKVAKSSTAKPIIERRKTKEDIYNYLNSYKHNMSMLKNKLTEDFKNINIQIKQSYDLLKIKKSNVLWRNYLKFINAVVLDNLIELTIFLFNNLYDVMGGTITNGTTTTGTTTTGTTTTGTATIGTTTIGTATTSTATTGTSKTGTAITGTAITGTAITGAAIASGTTPTTNNVVTSLTEEQLFCIKINFCKQKLTLDLKLKSDNSFCVATIFYKWIEDIMNITSGIRRIDIKSGDYMNEILLNLSVNYYKNRLENYFEKTIKKSIAYLQNFKKYEYILTKDIQKEFSLFKEKNKIHLYPNYFEYNNNFKDSLKLIKLNIPYMFPNIMEYEKLIMSLKGSLNTFYNTKTYERINFISFHSVKVIDGLIKYTKKNITLYTEYLQNFVKETIYAVNSFYEELIHDLNEPAVVNFFDKKEQSEEDGAKNGVEYVLDGSIDTTSLSDKKKNIKTSANGGVTYSGQIGSGQIGSGQIGSGQMGNGQMGSGKINKDDKDDRDDANYQYNVNEKDIFYSMMRNLRSIKLSKKLIPLVFQKLNEIVQKLKELNITVDYNDILENVEKNKEKVEKQYNDIKEKILKYKNKEVKNIKNEIITLKEQINKIKKYIFENVPNSPNDIYNTSYKKINEFYASFEIYKEKQKCHKELEVLFEMDVTVFNELKEIGSHLKMLKHFWDVVNGVIYYIKEEKQKIWTKIDVNINIYIIDFVTLYIRKNFIELKHLPIYEYIIKELKKLSQILPLLIDLNNKFVFDRHWNIIINISGSVNSLYSKKGVVNITTVSSKDNTKLVELAMESKPLDIESEKKNRVDNISPTNDVLQSDDNVQPKEDPTGMDVGTVPIATTPMVTTPMATTPMVTTPMATTPMATTPMVTTPMATTPMATTPMATTPMATTPIATTPMVTTPIATTPMATAPITTTPITTTPNGVEENVSEPKSDYSINKNLKIKYKELTLQELFDLKLYKHVDAVHDVIEQAKKEKSIENKIKEINDIWKNMNFECVKKKNHIYITNMDNIIELVDEHTSEILFFINQKKFILFIQETILNTQENLKKIDEVINIWKKFLSKFERLQPIYLNSEDIHSQLPQESKMFMYIEKEYKEIITSAYEQKNILQVCLNEDLFYSLNNFFKNIELCEKALNDYLDQKKKAFPRFYFLSNIALLDILSNGKNPLKILPYINDVFNAIKTIEFVVEDGYTSKLNGSIVPDHLKKGLVTKPTADLIAVTDNNGDNVSGLRKRERSSDSYNGTDFNEDGIGSDKEGGVGSNSDTDVSDGADTYTGSRNGSKHRGSTTPRVRVYKAKGVYSIENEHLVFSSELILKGNVEFYLKELENHLKVNIRNILESSKLCCEMLDEQNRDETIINNYISQVVCTCNQINITEEINKCFDEIENGNETAFLNYKKILLERINKLIKLVEKTDDYNIRTKLLSLIILDVHTRDVIISFIKKKIFDSTSFDWQAQLKYFWIYDKKINNYTCEIRLCDFKTKYLYEYIGNSGKLVITPLTDKCYITLTQALNLILGGAPAGPAGTGKTETTKDLSKAIGIAIFIFNCSNQMDYMNMSQIFIGLSQTGAWGCFDEFNRISIEVLSVVSTQIKCIFDAIKENKKMFHFMDDEINLKKTCGFFITMNPGYAGRTELPENLKNLFRSCSMIVPDVEFICENMLMSFGFIKANKLSFKFVELYHLCKELLEKNIHYDWGLRAVKVVLIQAGNLKRKYNNFDEEAILMKALKDFNIPKITYNDIPIFLGLVNDLFPNVDISVFDKVGETDEQGIGIHGVTLPPTGYNNGPGQTQNYNTYGDVKTKFVDVTTGHGSNQTKGNTDNVKSGENLGVDRVGGAIDRVEGAIDGVGGAIDGVGGAIDRVEGAIDGVRGAIDGVGGAIDGVGGAAGGTKADVTDQNKETVVYSFEQAIRMSLNESNLQIDDTFILKVKQLKDLMDVRHCVFILGEEGCGKSCVFEILIKCLNKMGERCLYEIINPKSIESYELYGYLTKNNEWKDGALSSIMRKMSRNLPPYNENIKHKILLLDGNIDADWIESMNTVMDDNKVLTLVSNERIPFTKQMHLFFEITNMKYASPATVSRGGVLYINKDDISYKLFLNSWISLLNNNIAKNEFYYLFNIFYAQNIKIVRKQCKLVFDLSDLAIVKSICTYIDYFLMKYDKYIIEVIKQIESRQTEESNFVASTTGSASVDVSGRTTVGINKKNEENKKMGGNIHLNSQKEHKKIDDKKINKEEKKDKSKNKNDMSSDIPERGNKTGDGLTGIGSTYDDKNVNKINYNYEILKDYYNSFFMNAYMWVLNNLIVDDKIMNSRNMFSNNIKNNLKVKMGNDYCCDYIYNIYDNNWKHLSEYMNDDILFLQKLNWGSDRVSEMNGEGEGEGESSGEGEGYNYDPLTSDQLTSDQLTSDQLTSDQLTSDQLTSDQLTSDQLTSDPSQPLGKESGLSKSKATDNEKKNKKKSSTKKKNTTTDYIENMLPNKYDEIYINTIELIRIEKMIKYTLEQNKSILVYGSNGTGKTKCIKNNINMNIDKFTHTIISINYYTNSYVLQKLIENNVEKRNTKTYGPPNQKKHIFFLEDLNITAKDMCDTQQTLELLRQLLTYKLIYDRVNLDEKKYIHDIYFIGTINNNTNKLIDKRIQNKFNIINLDDISMKTFENIYKIILKQHLLKFDDTIKKLLNRIIMFSYDVYNHIIEHISFNLSNVAPHYLFNLNDIHTIFYNIIKHTNPNLYNNNPFKFLMMFLHETQHAYTCKLVSEEHMQIFLELFNKLILQHFPFFKEEFEKHEEMFSKNGGNEKEGKKKKKMHGQDTSCRRCNR